jgi:hypothetical protein
MIVYRVILRGGKFSMMAHIREQGTFAGTVGLLNRC